MADKKQLFETDTPELNGNYVDKKELVLIPENPDHWHAIELRYLVEKMKKQLENSPQQFNSANYIQALNNYVAKIKEIKNGQDSVGEIPDGETPAVGEGNAASVDSGVSPDNPTAG